MSPTLVVLAAGMGSRYGGLKQIDPMGPTGETILDYSVYDAMRAGFGRVVFIIRPDFEDAFRSGVAARFADRVLFFAQGEVAFWGSASEFQVSEDPQVRAFLEPGRYVPVLESQA